MASQGLASRREAERWIRAGEVEINGTVEKTLGRKINPLKDKIRVKGKPVEARATPLVYWVLNKPDGVLTSKSDPQGRTTIFDLPALRRVPFTIYPVGRLDFRTEGVLLLSNDGELVHRLMHPRYHVPRLYEVVLPRRLNEKELARFAQGFRLSDGPTAPIDIHASKTVHMGATRGYRYRLVVNEGRNRLVRRIFEKLGVRIVRLIRVAYGPVRMLPEALPGALQPLRADQILRLKQQVGLASEPPPARKPHRKHKPSRAVPNPTENPRTPAPMQ
jgi:pseudouridine synthase